MPRPRNELGELEGEETVKEKRKLVPAKRAKRKWTKEEEHYLQDKWGTLSVQGIANKLGRSENAIVVRAQRMNLGAHLMGSHKVSVNQLMKTIQGGKQQGNWTRDRWIRHGLPVTRQKVKTSSFLMIDLDDFWKWAEDNQEIINLSLLEENSLGAEPEWAKKKRRIDIKEKFKKTPWTESEDRRLKQLLEQYQHTYADLCRILKRTEGAIKRRINTLGLKERPLRKYNRHWTEEETDTLLELRAKGHGWEHIGQQLKRSGSACRGKFERLQNPEYSKRYHRNNREKLAEYFQKDQCKHYTRALGCQINKDNCDICTHFIRRDPEEEAESGWNSAGSIKAQEILEERQRRQEAI